MLWLLQTAGWLACVVYSTIPMFWLMIHPRAQRWRERARSPYRVLVPAWITMWIGVGALTGPWRQVALYSTAWSWAPAGLLFAAGFWIYAQAGMHFSWAQLGGLPEIRQQEIQERREQHLVTTGIRARVRHPVYLGHLCEMLAWSVGTGLVVCWLLTGFAMITGAVMIRMEDAELETLLSEHTPSGPKLSLAAIEDPQTRMLCEDVLAGYSIGEAAQRSGLTSAAAYKRLNRLGKNIQPECLIM